MSESVSVYTSLSTFLFISFSMSMLDTRNGFRILKNIYGNDENVRDRSKKLLKRRIGNPQVFSKKSANWRSAPITLIFTVAPTTVPLRNGLPP
jgi:hypothetical protein